MSGREGEIGEAVAEVLARALQPAVGATGQRAPPRRTVDSRVEAGEQAGCLRTVTGVASASGAFDAGIDVLWEVIEQRVEGRRRSPWRVVVEARALAQLQHRGQGSVGETPAQCAARRVAISGQGSDDGGNHGRPSPGRVPGGLVAVAEHGEIEAAARGQQPGADHDAMRPRG